MPTCLAVIIIPSCDYNSYLTSCDYNPSLSSCDYNSYLTSCDYNPYLYSCDFNSHLDSYDPYLPKKLNLQRLAVPQSEEMMIRKQLITNMTCLISHKLRTLDRGLVGWI